VMPKAIDDYEQLVDRSQIWLERTQGLGFLSADDAIALGQSGPCCARQASTGICAASSPYPRVRQGRFPRARCTARATSMRATACGWKRCASPVPDRRPGHAPHARRAVDRRRPQGRAARRAKSCHTSMESLIHHFKIVTGGLPRPRGRGLRHRRVAARGARLLRRLGRRARSRGA
jgi:NADH-quinone oxidoreductase subunit D